MSPSHHRAIPIDNAAVERGPRERLLIVDDSDLVRRLFSVALSDTYECVEARSFEEANSKIKDGEFAVVITDIMMPGISGIELLRKVVGDHPATKVIVASGVDRGSRVLDAMRLGAFDYLIKPVDASVLRFTVERAVEAREMLARELRYKDELREQRRHLNELQARIVHQEKMASLGQMAAGVAHELNNPVGFVHSNIEFIEAHLEDVARLLTAYDELDLTDSQAEKMREMREAIDHRSTVEEMRGILADCKEGSTRVRDIVQNLRTFSRLDEAEFKQTDINEGIDSTVRLLSRQCSASGVQILREYCGVPRVSAFASQLNQVWMNLLLNAIHAVGNSGGKIKIATWEDEESVYVSIEDNGCGIPVQNLSRLFEPFFTTKSIGEGTGLGLAITFSIVERHGGTIAVNSKMGEGTTFTVSLPKQFQPDFTADEKAIALF